MKKLFLALLLSLTIAGAFVLKSNAANIPAYVDPQAGPEIWLTPVYNNSGGTLDVGDVVIWDIEQSTGDNDNYVTTTTTADTFIVAGVVYPADIAAGATGNIAIKGVVATDAIDSHLTIVDGPACTSGTAGSARSCTTAAAAFGFVTQAASGNSALVCVNCDN